MNPKETKITRRALFIGATAFLASACRDPQPENAWIRNNQPIKEDLEPTVLEEFEKEFDALFDKGMFYFPRRRPYYERGSEIDGEIEIITQNQVIRIIKGKTTRNFKPLPEEKVETLTSRDYRKIIIFTNEELPKYPGEETLSSDIEYEFIEGYQPRIKRTIEVLKPTGRGIKETELRKLTDEEILNIIHNLKKDLYDEIERRHPIRKTGDDMKA